MSSEEELEPPALAQPRRLHPAAVVIATLGSLRQILFPAVAAFVGLLSGGDSTLDRATLVAVVAAFVSIAAGVIAWRTTIYRLDEGVLRVRRGRLRVRETALPLERIQAVDSLRGPVQRLFGVVELRVQAAGGGPDAEVALSALAPAAADELRRALDARPRSAVAGAPVGPTRHLDRRGLLAAALTAGQFGVIVPLLAAASQLADDVVGDSLAGIVSEVLPRSLFGVGLAALALAAVAWLISILGTLVAFAGFTVSREGDRLRIRRGVLQRREATVPVARVHAVRMVEGLLRQPLGFAQLRVESAGYAAEPAAVQTLFPLIRRRDVPAFLLELLPELADELDRLAPAPARAARRYVIPPLLVLALLGVAGAIWLPASSYATVLVLPLVAGHGVLRHRDAGWRLEHGRLVVRSRRLARITVVAEARRLEERSAATSPLQRRAGLASFSFAVGSRARFGIAHLDSHTVDGLIARLDPRIDRSRSG